MRNAASRTHALEIDGGGRSAPIRVAWIFGADRPRRPRRAPVLSKSCARVVENSHREPRCGPMSASVGLNRPKLWRCWRNTGQVRPTSVQIGKCWRELATNCPKLNTVWPMSVKVGQPAATLVPKAAKLGRVWSMLAECWPKLGQFLANLGRVGPESTVRRPTFENIWLTLC